MLSEEVDSFKSLKELILMEHFANLADMEIGTESREKRFRTVKEAATWADDRLLALRASGAKPVSYCATFFTRDKHASGAAWDNKNTCQGKEKKEGNKSYQAKIPPTTSRLTCFYCKQEGHIKPNCAKWKATHTPKPVALVMGSGRLAREAWSVVWVVTVSWIASMGKASLSSPLVRPSPKRSLDSGLDYCEPFMCQGTVIISGVAYPLTVFRDTGAQQSVCRYVTGESVSTGRYVLCRRMNSVEYYDSLGL